jgi:hypothetical protein
MNAQVIDFEKAAARELLRDEAFEIELRLTLGRKNLTPERREELKRRYHDVMRQLIPTNKA